MIEMNFLTAGNRFIFVIMKCYDKEAYTHAYVDSVFGLSGWLCSRLQNMYFCWGYEYQHWWIWGDLFIIFDYTFNFQYVCVLRMDIGDTLTGSVLVAALHPLIDFANSFRASFCLPCGRNACSKWILTFRINAFL